MRLPLILFLLSLNAQAQLAPLEQNYQYGQPLLPQQFVPQDPVQKQEEQNFRNQLLRLEQEHLVESQKQTELIFEQEKRIEEQNKTLEQLNDELQEQQDEIESLQENLKEQSAKRSGSMEEGREVH